MRWLILLIFSLGVLRLMPTDFSDPLNVIYELESSSGRNRKAYTPNQYGAVGGYQLTPAAFTDVQRFKPSVWGKMKFNDVAVNDALAREAARDYIDVLGRQLRALDIVPTVDNLLAAYHSGAGNVGRLGPEGRNYVARSRALAGVPAGKVY